MRVEIEQAGKSWQVSENGAVVGVFRGFDRALDRAARLFRMRKPRGAAALLLRFCRTKPGAAFETGADPAADGEAGP